MKTKRCTLKTSFVTLTVVLFLPILCSLVKGPDREIEARTSPMVHTIRGSIFDRSGTLLAFSDIDTDGLPKRVYPYNDLARALIGETDLIGRGISGIELVMDDGLSQGKDVFLTLEREVQIRASDLIQLQLRRFKASYGCMIVMDIASGEILALSSKKHNSKAHDSFLSAPYEERLFYAGGILLPLKWRLNFDNDLLEQPRETKRSRWTSIENKYLVWSPWDEGFILSNDGSRSYTKELIGLGLGRAPDKIPLYVTDVFDVEFKATPLHILQAFAHLLVGKETRPPQFVKDEWDPSGNTRSQIKHDDQKEPQTTVKDEIQHLQKALSNFTVPALATVWWNVDENRQRSCEIVALGYWPKGAPKVVYITAIKGALKDPRKRPGYLSLAKEVLKAANLVPTESISLAVIK